MKIRTAPRFAFSYVALPWLCLACSSVTRNFERARADAGNESDASASASSILTSASVQLPDAAPSVPPSNEAGAVSVSTPDAQVPQPSQSLPDAAPTGAADASDTDPNTPPQNSGPAGLEAGTPPEASVVPPDPLPECVLAGMDDVGHQSATTAEADGQFTPTCVAAGLSDDVAFLWQAPATGYYTFSTEGSSFDTVLSLRTPACSGDEVECNDDGPTGTSSEIVKRFTRDQQAIVVVDGKLGSHGTVELNVASVTCPAQDLTEQVLPATLSNQDGTNVHEGACGGAGRREKTLRWVAPGDGAYRFRVTSTDFSPSIYAEKGPRCGGVELGCSLGGSLGSPAWVTQYLSAGEAVTLIVDSNDGVGDFTIDVESIGYASCSFGDYAPLDDYLISGTLTAQDSTSIVSGSCAPAEVLMIPNGSYPLPEHSYNVHVPARASCTISITANAPFTVYGREGSECVGREDFCEVSALNGEGAESVRLRLGDTTNTQSIDGTLVIEAAVDLQDGPLTYEMYGVCAIP